MTNQRPYKRERHPMPEYISEALEKNKLSDAYDARPPYQRNDYIGWITGGKREATRKKRLEQMISELGKGDVYMKMKWNPKV